MKPEPLLKRPNNFFLPSIVLDRTSPVPLHVQLRTQVATAIRRDGPDAGRLPSTRTLARILGVSRNTVLAAYDDLAADGLIVGQHGSGMRVSTERRSAPSPIDISRLVREAQYPARTFCIADPDGTPLYLTY